VIFAVGPFGRFFGIRKDLALGAKSVSEGGSGTGEAFWEWCEEQVKQYL
jgi:retinol dehydrogenase 12